MITRHKQLLLIGLPIIAAGLVGAALYANSKKSSVQSHRTYSLNLMSGTTYEPTAASKLSFDIRDEKNNVLRTFDTVHEKLLHLIVVREDRTNFQHLHPEFDSSTGTFTISDVKFPTSGQYRVFADFTPADSQKDAMGVKLAATPYKDVKVGTGDFTPEGWESDKLSSSAGGFDTNVFFPPSDDSPGGGLLKDFYAGADSSVNIAINKNGARFTGLENYLGALGHMVVLGPNLEFIHAHPMASDVKNQSGLISFMVNFPAAGRYVAYLQTQANGRVNTTNYAVSVLPKPSDGDSGMMDHSSH